MPARRDADLARAGQARQGTALSDGDYVAFPFEEHRPSAMPSTRRIARRRVSAVVGWRCRQRRRRWCPPRLLAEQHAGRHDRFDPPAHRIAVAQRGEEPAERTWRRQDRHPTLSRRMPMRPGSSSTSTASARAGGLARPGGRRRADQRDLPFPRTLNMALGGPARAVTRSPCPRAAATAPQDGAAIREPRRASCAAVAEHRGHQRGPATRCTWP